MERLTALDASFLYGETPETPMHVASLVICEPPREGVKPYEAFREYIRQRLHLLAFFERKLGLSPVQLDHPVWIADKPDLDYHVRHMALPSPGNQEQLITLIARLHMILLDRARPLWQFYVIEGLEGGGFALYLKMHHATIDGGASTPAVETIFGYDPEPAPVAPPPTQPQKEAMPNIFELISASYSNFFNQQRDFIQSWPDITKAIANVGKRMREDVTNPPQFQRAPKTIFNAKLSNQRSYAICSLPLQEIKDTGKALDAKINDVVMTICGGALRRYLQGRNALPAESLIAAIPVSLREAGNADMNNQVTSLMAKLATDVADPVERIKVIVESTKDAKDRLGDVRDVIPTDFSFFGAPIMISGMARMMGQGEIANQMPAMMNVLISNVPGPRRPLYCVGSKVTGYFPVSIPTHGGILNMTCVSYCDDMEFGLIACRDGVPDIEKMTDYLVEEFAVLKEAAAAKRAAA